MKSKGERNGRRKYDAIFKEEIIRRHLDGEPAPGLAERFEIRSTTLIYRWKEQALEAMAVGEGGLSPARMKAEPAGNAQEAQADREGARHPKNCLGHFQPRMSEIYTFVGEHSGQFPVSVMCDTFGIARSGYNLHAAR